MQELADKQNGGRGVHRCTGYLAAKGFRATALAVGRISNFSLANVGLALPGLVRPCPSIGPNRPRYGRRPACPGQTSILNDTRGEGVQTRIRESETQRPCCSQTVTR